MSHRLGFVLYVECKWCLDFCNSPASRFEAHLELGKVKEKRVDCVWICGGSMTFDTILCAQVRIRLNESL